MTGIIQQAEAVARRVTAHSIIIATIARPTGWTGVHTHFSEFLRVLPSTGYRGALVTPFSGQESLANAVFAPRRVLSRVHPVANVWWYEEGHFHMLKRALSRILRDAGEVTVYAQCPLSARAALQTRKGPHQHVVMAVHFNGSQADEWVAQAGLSSQSRLYAAIRRREQRVLPALDGIIYVSRFMKDRLETSVPAVRDVPSAIVPNFVPAMDTAAQPQAQSADLISVGTLEPRKNQAYLLRVLHEANRMGHRYTLDIVGDGPDRAKLESLAQELGIRHQVRFLGFERYARNLLPGHRAFVHAAKMESFGIVLAEAMAARLPVFAAPVGGIPEVFEDGREGAYWDLSDPEAGAGTLVALLESPARYNSAASAGRYRFESSYESSVVAARLLRFLLERRSLSNQGGSPTIPPSEVSE